MIVWTATEIETKKVYIFGWNSSVDDLTSDKITYVKTCVDNFQLKKEVPLKKLGDAHLIDWELTLPRKSSREYDIEDPASNLTWKGCFY